MLSPVYGLKIASRCNGSHFALEASQQGTQEEEGGSGNAFTWHGPWLTSL